VSDSRGGPIVARLSKIGADLGDSTDLRLRKTLLVSVALMVLPASILWGLLFWAAGEPVPAVCAWAYAVGSITSLVVFRRTRSYEFLRWAQLMLVLWAPFLFGVAAGGLVPSGGVVLWSFLAPLGAIAFNEPRRAWPWLGGFLVMVAVTTPLAEIIRPDAAQLPEILVVVLLGLNIGAVSLIAFVLLAAFATQRADAQRRADSLLLNILPAEIAELLKAEPQVIAEQFDDVSVLFADVVDFTRMAARLSAHEVVGLLDRLFTDFDAVVERHGLEKIKTIGDAYMIAAGVPRRRPDHAAALADAALDIQAVASNYRRDDGEPLSLRIGMASGTVVAGVIGRRKFLYDLWGDVVNTASRMESHGAAGRIQVDAATYDLLDGDFVCEPRGTIDVKGKGLIETWYVTGRRT
jgi:adenylate cyclase